MAGAIYAGSAAAITIATETGVSVWGLSAVQRAMVIEKAQGISKKYVPDSRKRRDRDFFPPVIPSCRYRRQKKARFQAGLQMFFQPAYSFFLPAALRSGKANQGGRFTTGSHRRLPCPYFSRKHDRHRRQDGRTGSPAPDIIGFIYKEKQTLVFKRRDDYKGLFLDVDHHDEYCMEKDIKVDGKVAVILESPHVNEFFNETLALASFSRWLQPTAGSHSISNHSVNNQLKRRPYLLNTEPITMKIPPAPFQNSIG